MSRNVRNLECLIAIPKIDRPQFDSNFEPRLSNITIDLDPLGPLITHEENQLEDMEGMRIVI